MGIMGLVSWEIKKVAGASATANTNNLNTNRRSVNPAWQEDPNEERT